MYRRTVKRTQLYSLFLRSVLASDYFWCYAKYTSDILNFTLLHFKELVISPEIHPLRTSRSPIQEKKNYSMREELYYRHTTNLHHHNFSLTQGSVTNGFFGAHMYEGVTPGIKYSFLIQLK